MEKKKIKDLIDDYKEEEKEIIKLKDENEGNYIKWAYYDGRHFEISDIISDLELVLKNISYDS